MRRLKCLHEYINGPRGLHFHAGAEIEVEDDVAEFLLRDAPICFEVIKAKAMKAPPKDKAMKTPLKDK